jgi:3-oxoadipate enol-lactonase / 4-carboxymuconolactone decarboxylase
VTVPRITALKLGGEPRLPLLLLGPSLGTSARALWSVAAAPLIDSFEVLAWDLPGHGDNRAPFGPFDVADLAAGVLAMVDDRLAERGEPGRSFAYAGDSIGGAVGLQLLLDAPGRVDAAVLLCTGAKIGEAQDWRDRAATVRRSGTSAVAAGSAARWFADGFIEREPATSSALLAALQETDGEAYALVCEALAGYDVRSRLAEVAAPVLAVAGAKDLVTRPSSLQAIADGVQDGRLAVLDDVAHMAPAEAPLDVARLIMRHLTGARRAESPTATAVRAAGLVVRREVLGDAHVDRATAAATDFTTEFQDFITQYAWGTIWTRPGLDRRSRSLITLTALVARGHHDELAMHVRAARTNGLTTDEIKELLLQTAVYCGVPDANSAFKIAQRVLADLDQENA